MAKSFVFFKMKYTLQWSQRVFDIKLESVSVKKLVSVKIGNFKKLVSVCCFYWRKGRYRYVIYFTESVSVRLESVSVKKSVSVKIGKFVKIGIGMFFLLDKKIDIGMLFTLQNRYRYRYG